MLILTSTFDFGACKCAHATPFAKFLLYSFRQSPVSFRIPEQIWIIEGTRCRLVSPFSGSYPHVKCQPKLHFLQLRNGEGEDRRTEDRRTDIAANDLDLASFLCTQPPSFIVFSFSLHTIFLHLNIKWFLFSLFWAPQLFFTENIYQIIVQDLAPIRHHRKRSCFAEHWLDAWNLRSSLFWHWSQEHISSLPHDATWGKVWGRPRSVTTSVHLTFTRCVRGFGCVNPISTLYWVKYGSFRCCYVGIPTTTNLAHSPPPDISNLEFCGLRKPTA